MSVQNSEKQLPLSYGLPPPPSTQPSGRRRGRGRGRGYGNGYGRYQPLLRQNNQRQTNIYTMTSEESKVAQPSYKKQIESTQNPQNLLGNQNDNTFLINTMDSNKVSSKQKKLAKSSKVTPQDRFINLLNSFEGVHNEMWKYREGNDNQTNLMKANSSKKFIGSDDKSQNLSKKREDEQDGSAYSKKEGFMAAAKAALAATAALQYKTDDNHNNAQEPAVSQSNYQMNNQKFNDRGPPAANSKKLISDESRLKPVMDFHLDTPEEIAKWIEQRKRNYPTDANIARNKELEAARIARGKVLKAQAQAQKKRSLNQDSEQRATKKNRVENGKMDIVHNGLNGIIDLLVAASSAGVHLNAGQMRTIQSLQSGNRINKVFCRTVPNSTISKKDNAMGKLYRNICIKYRQGHCPRGKDCANKHTGKMICPPIQRPPDSARCRQRNLRELLLYKEIVEEKNVILQCIRHIVNKNFFGVVTNKAIKNAKERGEALIVEVKDQQTRTSTTGKNKKKKISLIKSSRK